MAINNANSGGGESSKTRINQYKLSQVTGFLVMEVKVKMAGGFTLYHQHRGVQPFLNGGPIQCCGHTIYIYTYADA